MTEERYREMDEEQAWLESGGAEAEANAQASAEGVMTESRYFLTVDWCNQGKRGVFCSKDGTPFTKSTPHTEDDIWEILDCFSVVLSPDSREISFDELDDYDRFYPLAEFSNEYGIAVKEEEP